MAFRPSSVAFVASSPLLREKRSPAHSSRTAGVRFGRLSRRFEEKSASSILPPAADRTNYLQQFSSSGLDLALFIESDRMASTLICRETTGCRLHGFSPVQRRLCGILSAAARKAKSGAFFPNGRGAIWEAEPPV